MMYLNSFHFWCVLSFCGSDASNVRWYHWQQFMACFLFCMTAIFVVVPCRVTIWTNRCGWTSMSVVPWHATIWTQNWQVFGHHKLATSPHPFFPWSTWWHLRGEGRCRQIIISYIVEAHSIDYLLEHLLHKTILIELIHQVCQNVIVVSMLAPSIPSCSSSTTPQSIVIVVKTLFSSSNSMTNMEAVASQCFLRIPAARGTISTLSHDTCSDIDKFLSTWYEHYFPMPPSKADPARRSWTCYLQTHLCLK